MHVITLIASINNFHYLGFHERDTRLHAQGVRCDSIETDDASYTFVLRIEVSEEISRMLSEGIIGHIDTSPWMLNVVIVRKKSGDIRLCLDLRQVNKAVIPDTYPIPSREELMSEFNGSTVFSKLDLSQGYL